MAANNAPNLTDDASPPDQFIPISSTQEMHRSTRRSGSGCMIAALIALIALCVVAGVIAGAALAGYWFMSSPVASTPVAQASETALPVPTTYASATITLPPSLVPTQDSPATLTPFPTNTLPATQPASPTVQPQLTSTITPKPTWLPCTGSYYSRLYVGSIAYVSFDPPLPNRVRSQPNTASDILGMLQPGERMEIIGGPVCSNQWIWWQIRSQATGLVGWTAEGDAKSYWLVPSP
jgi:hypothetical protein